MSRDCNLLIMNNKAVALTNVFNLLQGIVNQGIWKKRDETLITTDALDLATIDQAILDIITGDYALLCLSLEPRGVNPAKAARYNQYVVQTLQIILAAFTPSGVTSNDLNSTLPLARGTRVVSLTVPRRLRICTPVFRA